MRKSSPAAQVETTWRTDPSDPQRERIWLGDSWGSTTRPARGTGAGGEASPAKSGSAVGGFLAGVAVAIGLGGFIAGIILIADVGLGVGLAVLFGALIQSAVFGGLSYLCGAVDELRAAHRRSVEG